MNTAPAPPPFWLNNSLLLWLVVRVVGGILLAVLVCAGILLLADPEPTPDPSSNNEWADGMGGGVAMALLWVWGLWADFIGSLPLLVLSTPLLRWALQAPTAPARRWRVFGCLAGWQALPGLGVAAWLGTVKHDSEIFFGCLGVTLLYLVITLVVARLLYAPWLADNHPPTTTYQPTD